MNLLKLLNMKTHLLLALLSAAVLTVSFQSPKNGNLKIFVTDLKNANGELDFNIFNSADGFPGDETKVIKHLRGKIKNGSCTITFENLPYGKYAVSIYHDENNDKQMNKSWYGKPTEGVAVSNNAKGSISGPPSFEEARFEFSAQTNSLNIKMNYF
jgi:uncharacterized protein (DUF2141 family)